MADKPIVLVVGDPVSGFTFYGPTIANDPDLEELTQQLGRDQYWWYADLLPVPTSMPAAPPRRSRYRLGRSITEDYLVEEHFPDRVHLVADYTSLERAQAHLDRLREEEH